MTALVWQIALQYYYIIKKLNLVSSVSSLYCLSDPNHIFCTLSINCKGSNLRPRLLQFWKINVGEFKADTDYQQHCCNSSAQSLSPALVRKKAWAWPCATDSELHNTSVSSTPTQRAPSSFCWGHQTSLP